MPTFPDARLRLAGLSTARIAALRAEYDTSTPARQQTLRGVYVSATDETIRNRFGDGTVDTVDVSGALAAAHDTDAERESFVPARLSTTALRAAYGRDAPDVVWKLGDSISANGLTQATATADRIWASQDYLQWACLMSLGRLRYGGAAATGGYRTDQIIAEHLPTVIAARPRFCVVHAGTNDTGTLTQAQTYANLAKIFDSLLAAGITPIGTTQLPKQTLLNANRAVLDGMSLFVTRYARDKGFPLLDWTSPFILPTTGGWQGGAPGTYVVDNVHPNGTGAKIMGQTLLDTLTPLVRNPTPPLPTNINGLTGYFQPSIDNALLLADSNADGVTNGATASAGTGATYTLPAMSAGEGFGNWQTLTKAGTGNPFLQFGSTATVPGHRMRFSCKIKASVKAGGGWWHVRLVNGNTTDVTALRGMTEDLALGLWVTEFTVPTMTAQNLKVAAQLDVGNGSLGIGEISLLDLTAAGLA